MQSELKPDKGVIAEHLRHLFHWTSPENKFEVRCIHPAQRTIRSKLYGCAEFAQAAEFAAQANADGFNAYVTVNPLSPGVTDAAKDADVVGARWQIIDVDGVADPGEIAKKSDIAPTMVVITGTVPAARFHAYWLLDRDTDPVSWSQTQKGLATAFESDPSITRKSLPLYRNRRLPGGKESYGSWVKEQGSFTRYLLLHREWDIASCMCRLSYLSRSEGHTFGATIPVL